MDLLITEGAWQTQPVSYHIVQFKQELFLYIFIFGFQYIIFITVTKYVISTYCMKIM